MCRWYNQTNEAVSQPSSKQKRHCTLGKVLYSNRMNQIKKASQNPEQHVYVFLFFLLPVFLTFNMHFKLPIEHWKNYDQTVLYDTRNYSPPKDSPSIASRIPSGVCTALDPQTGHHLWAGWGRVDQWASWTAFVHLDWTDGHWCSNYTHV